MNTSEVRTAINAMSAHLAAWIAGEVERGKIANEISSREGFVRELAYLHTSSQPGPSQCERLRLLEQGAVYDKERLAELYEERRRHQDLTERLIKAEYTLFRFGDERGINTDPLRRLLDGDLECADVVIPILRRLLAALDVQPTEQLPAEGSRLDEKDVPALFREGGKPDGEVLTAPYLEESTNWLLKGPYLSKHYGPGKELTTHIRVGRAKAYLYCELLVLRDRKTANEE